MRREAADIRPWVVARLRNLDFHAPIGEIRFSLFRDRVQMALLQVLFGVLLVIVCLPISGVVGLVTFLFTVSDKRVFQKSIGAGVMTFVILWVGYFWWVFG